jgi:hypothetical protein
MVITKGSSWLFAITEQLAVMSELPAVTASLQSHHSYEDCGVSDPVTEVSVAVRVSFTCATPLMVGEPLPNAGRFRTGPTLAVKIDDVPEPDLLERTVTVTLANMYFPADSLAGSSVDALWPEISAQSAGRDTGTVPCAAEHWYQRYE